MATYAMETKSGNILVDGIVQTAISNEFDYEWVYSKHLILSKKSVALGLYLNIVLPYCCRVNSGKTIISVSL